MDLNVYNLQFQQAPARADSAVSSSQARSQVLAQVENTTGREVEPRVQAVSQQPADTRRERRRRERAQASGGKKEKRRVIRSYLLGGTAMFKNQTITSTDQLVALFGSRCIEEEEASLYKEFKYRKELVGEHFEWEKDLRSG